MFLLLGAADGVIAQKTKKKGKSTKAELSYEDELQARRYFLNATRARLMGNDEEARDLFLKCLKIDGKNDAAKYELSKLYHHAKQTDLALQYAQEAVELDEKNTWYRFLLADLYLETNQPDKAADTYRAVIELAPTKYEVYFELAQVYINDGDYEEALKVYDELQEEVGYAEEVVMQRYHLLIGLGEFNRAIDLLLNVIEEHPTDPRFRGVLAELYDQTGESEKALEQYLKVLEVDPGNSMIHLALAEHYQIAGDIDKAFEELKLAFSDPEVDIDTKVQILLNFYDVTNGTASAGSEREKLKESADELMDILLAVHPGNARTYTILGDYQLRENKLEEARESFRKAVELEPDKFVIWHQIVLIDSQLNDQVALIRESGLAMELFPTMPVFYLYQGVALNLEEHHDEAIEALIAGKDLVIDDPRLLAQFYSSLGDAYHAIKEHELSDESYDKCLENEPNNIYVLNNYSYYLSLREEDLEKAEKMSLRSNELQPGQASFQDTYAWILFKLERYEDARVWIEKALNNGGDNSGEVVEHYGDILFKLGDERSALDQWLKAKELGETSDLIDKKISDRRLYD